MYPNSANTSLCLLSIINKLDALGVGYPTITSKRNIVGCIKSITSSDYQTSIMLNKKFDYKVVIQCFLYRDEKFVLLKEQIFKVERTYQVGQFLELYLSLSDLNKDDLIDGTRS